MGMTRKLACVPIAATGTRLAQEAWTVDATGGAGSHEGASP